MGGSGALGTAALAFEGGRPYAPGGKPFDVTPPQDPIRAVFFGRQMLAADEVAHLRRKGSSFQ